jgi:hypothetical protein
MSKTYKLTMTHEFYLETNDIQEVVRNYQFPDFTDCESIVGEPRFSMGGNEWEEITKAELEESLA